MKWLQFLYDILRVILEFFGIKKKEQEEMDKKFGEEHQERLEEIDEKVENANDDELLDIAVDAGLVQRSCTSTTGKCTGGPERP